MKKYWLILLLVFSPSLLFAWGVMGVSGGVVVSSEGECSTTPFYSHTTSTTTNYEICYSTSTNLSGVIFTNSTSKSDVCRIDFHLMGVGNVDAKDWRVEHWTGGNGTNDLGTYSVSSATVDGSDMPDDGDDAWVTFTFGTPITLAQNDSLVCTTTDHSVSSSNYLKKYLDGGNTGVDFEHIKSYTDGTTYYTHETYAVEVKVYSE